MSSWPRRDRARCWLRSRPPGCAIPTFPWSMGTGRARCPWCWGTRRRVWSRRWVTACPILCLPCAEGRPALCEPGALANGGGVLTGGHARLSEKAHALHHHLGVSAFAERAVVSRRSLVPVPRDIPFVEAALFGCAVLTGVGAVVNTAKLTMGSTAAVVGLGGVGLAALPASSPTSRRRICVNAICRACWPERYSAPSGSANPMSART